MTDLIDAGCDREERDRDAAIAAARSGEWLPFTGCCYNCDASVPDGHRFCDADCRDDWEKRNHA